MLKYGLLTCVLISVFSLYVTQGFSLYGHWTDKILFWIWIGATIKILIQYQTKMVKIYKWFLFVCLILLCIPFFSPIVTLISFSFGLERSFEKKNR
ncbi:MAG: hypothetical protein EAZ97_15880 [Bacteroidetes bacterium]|nr:MAG: hypothetical protein EAZ97_15880 [Bacteroidota bacterium]